VKIYVYDEMNYMECSSFLEEVAILSNLTHSNIIKFFGWSITPPHLFIIILTFILPYVNHGPIWNSTWEEEVQNCKNTWWQNLLYIQNYTDHHCWTHTWFLATAMQIQIVALFLMVFTFRYPKMGISVGLLSILGCFARDYIASYENKLEIFSHAKTRSFEFIWTLIHVLYIKPFNHYPSYLTGMALGYIHLKTKHRQMPKVYRISGWIISTILAFSIMYAVWLPNIDLRFAALYNCSRNVLWAFSFSWFFYACITGNGILTKLLSWKGLIVFDQISYFFYILHPLIFIYRYGSLRERIFLGKLEVLDDFLSLGCLSFVFSFIGYIIIEAPCNTAINLLLKKNSSASFKDSKLKKKM